MRSMMRERWSNSATKPSGAYSKYHRPSLAPSQKRITLRRRSSGRPPPRGAGEIASKVSPARAEVEEGTHEQIQANRRVTGLHLCDAGLTRAEPSTEVLLRHPSPCSLGASARPSSSFTSMRADSPSDSPRNSRVEPTFQPAASIPLLLRFVHVRSFSRLASSYLRNRSRHRSVTFCGVLAVRFSNTSAITMASESIR